MSNDPIDPEDEVVDWQDDHCGYDGEDAMTTNILTEEQLAEIETRARIATPPPWLVNPDQRKYVLMPFSSEEDVLRDRDANAAFCANARDDVPRLIAEIRRLQAELQPLQESDTYGWQPMMREIAKLSDALGLDDGDWATADDSTLLEQFDPWTVITAALTNITQHPYHEACPQCWERYQTVVNERDVCIDELKHRVAVDALKVVEQFYARVCARAEDTIARTHQVSGAHYAAMQVELKALREQSEASGDKHVD